MPHITRAKLDSMAEKTLARLFSEQSDSRPLFDRSSSYAVFILTKKGWKIGAKLTGSRYWPDEDLN